MSDTEFAESEYASEAEIRRLLTKVEHIIEEMSERQRKFLALADDDAQALATMEQLRDMLKAGMEETAS